MATGFGWLQMAKGLTYLRAPEKALRSMDRGGRSPRGIVAVSVMALGGWACYCLWRGAPRA